MEEATKDAGAPFENFESKGGDIALIRDENVEKN
jgi:hypothetical protein